MQDRETIQAPATDSPWFWFGIFLSGALVALTLTVPKYQWRQPQIERIYQARERSGMTISSHDGPQPLSTTGNPLITLKPLMWMLFFVIMVSTAVFWIQWWGQRRHRWSRVASDEKATQTPSPPN